MIALKEIMELFIKMDDEFPKTSPFAILFYKKVSLGNFHTDLVKFHQQILTNEFSMNKALDLEKDYIFYG